MKKTLTLVLAIMACSFLFSGCKKCVTCTEANTGVTSDYCGTNKNVKDFENELKRQGSAVGQNWSCVNK